MTPTVVRVFAPTTYERLTALDTDEVSVGPLVQLAEVGVDAAPDEVEQAEFDALCAAAAASLQLVLDEDATARRAVVVAGVGAQRLDRSSDAAALTGPIAWRDVEAVYVDETDAVDDVTALLDTARADLEPTEEQYAAVEERALLWFDPAERPMLADLSGR